MIDRLMDFVSAWGSIGRLCWIVAWQSTLWLVLGLVAARI